MTGASPREARRSGRPRLTRRDRGRHRLQANDRPIFRRPSSPVPPLARAIFAISVPFRPPFDPLNLPLCRGKAMREPNFLLRGRLDARVGSSPMAIREPVDEAGSRRASASAGCPGPGGRTGAHRAVRGTLRPLSAASRSASFSGSRSRIGSATGAILRRASTAGERAAPTAPKAPDVEALSPT